MEMIIPSLARETCKLTPLSFLPFYEIQQLIGWKTLNDYPTVQITYLIESDTKPTRRKSKRFDQAIGGNCIVADSPPQVCERPRKP